MKLQNCVMRDVNFRTLIEDYLEALVGKRDVALQILIGITI